MGEGLCSRGKVLCQQLIRGGIKLFIGGDILESKRYENAPECGCWMNHGKKVCYRLVLVV